MTGFIWNVEWNLFQQQCNIKAAVDFSIESETVEQRVSECTCELRLVIWSFV